MEYHKKEGNSAIYDNKDGPWRQYAKWKKSEQDITVLSHLHVESLKKNKIKKKNSDSRCQE